MTQETHPIVDLTQADLDAMLHRAMRNTLILGLVAALVVLIGGGWRSGAMLAIGTRFQRPASGSGSGWSGSSTPEWTGRRLPRALRWWCCSLCSGSPFLRGSFMVA